MYFWEVLGFCRESLQVPSALIFSLFHTSREMLDGLSWVSLMWLLGMMLTVAPQSTCRLTGLDLICISPQNGLSFFEATPLTKALRVFTEATSESESEQSESWFTERIFPFMALTSEPLLWFIFWQTFHLLPNAGHSSFFRTLWDCEQNLHFSFRSSVFFPSNKVSVRSPRLRFFLELGD